MKLIKMLGLAAVAAMAAMAIVGVSSASASTETIVLCEKAELVCESPFPNPTEIHGETKTPAKLLTSIGTVECETSLARVTLLNVLAKLVEGHLLELKFGGCKFGKTACTVTVNEVGGLSFEALGPKGTPLTAKVKAVELKGTGANTNATVKCGSLINCTYESGATTELTVHSDAEGHLLLLAFETELGNTGGFLCPAISKWDATYHAVNLDETLSLKLGLWIES